MGQGSHTGLAYIESQGMNTMALKTKNSVIGFANKFLEIMVPFF
jgi:hypothetical protein